MFASRTIHKSCANISHIACVQVDVSGLSGNNARVDVVEVVKGVSPLEGTVTLSYRDAYTDDLAFDASKEEVRSFQMDVDVVNHEPALPFDRKANSMPCCPAQLCRRIPLLL